MSRSPGIITRVKFISSKSSKYQKAIDYIDRKSATRGKHVEEWHAFSNEQSLHIKNTEGRVTTLCGHGRDCAKRTRK